MFGRKFKLDVRDDQFDTGQNRAQTIDLLGKAFAFAGPHKFTGRWLKGDLSILQWVHFVPDYDTWFNNTWITTWGQQNDVHVSLRVIACLAGTEEQALATGRLRRDLHARLSVLPVVPR